MSRVKEILNERKTTHGSFVDHAELSTGLKRIVHQHLNASHTNVMIESLDMIMHKVARILAGSPTHQDHWDDIAGYATLVSKSLEEK